MNQRLPSAPARDSAFRRAVRRVALLRESPVGMIGAGIVLFWVLVAVLAPLIAPFEPNATYHPYARPGAGHVGGGTFWLGADMIGRDILSRIIWGTRTVLVYAPLATFSAYVLGILMGLAAGYKRGWVDEVLSRLGDVLLSFPVLVLYIIVIATVGASGVNIVIAITVAGAPGVMRIVRGLTLEIGSRDFVAAARLRGEPAWYIMAVEILPNARGPLIVDACLRLGYVTITIGVLGFLGLGLPPPDADWGSMINQARGVAMAFPHMTVFPCIAISSLVLGFNLLADGLREISLRD
ncbi:MAG: ABC transporter permease [Alphaproteobacteria bacterium]|nr:ABC transporter permease [Pseudomonadota bacterium]MCZ6467099.1 ABC transporter permease [Alphaproteobacteria bacterium]MCZ6607560.1 ABC transporter permease [Alphaproteobacteria bacterium]